MVGQYGRGESLDLCKGYRLPSQWPPSYRRSLDAGTDGDVVHIISSNFCGRASRRESIEERPVVPSHGPYVRQD